MRNWLIPAAVVVVVNLAGIGAGWSINEWQDGDETQGTTQGPVPTAEAGPTEADLDAQRCAAALEAAGNVAPSRQGRVIIIPDEITQAIDRYCH